MRICGTMLCLVASLMLFGCGSKPEEPTAGPPPSPATETDTPSAPPSPAAGTDDHSESTGSPDTPSAPSTPTSPEMDQLLAHVPSRTTIVAMVRMDRLRNRPWIAEFSQHSPQVKAALEEGQAIESILVILAPVHHPEAEEFPPPSEYATVRIFSSEKAALADLQSRDLIEEEEYKGVTIYDDSNYLVMLRGRSLYESSGLDYLKELIDATGPSAELKALLDKAGLDKDVVFAGDFRSMQELLSSYVEELPEGLLTETFAQTLLEMHTAVASFDLQGDPLGSVKVQMANNESATQLANLTNAFLPVGKAMLLEQLANDFSIEQSETVTNVAENLFASIQVAADGAQLSGAANKPAGFDQWPTQLAPIMADAAKAANRQDRLRQIAIALHNYHDVYRCLPPAVIRNEQGEPLYSWRVALLPFLEHTTLYDKFHLDEPWDSPHNKPLSDEVVDIYGDENTTRILAVVGPGTAFEDKKGKSGWQIRDFTDGTSNTIFFVVAGPDKAVPWAKPADLPYKVEDDLLTLFGELEGGRLFTGFVDASVHQFDLESESEKIQAALIRNDGKVPR